MAEPVFRELRRGATAYPSDAPYFPDRAARMGAEGVAVIQCTLNAKGDLNACVAVDQKPDNMNFADAALFMAKRKALGAVPRQVDGAPVAEEVVRVRAPFVTARR